MISLRRSALALLAFVAVSAMRAQTLPAVTQPLADRTLPLGSPAINIDLKEHFGLPGVSGQVVQIETVVGSFNVELFDDTPITKANFLAYANAGRYNNTIVHRSVAGFVIQGGGYFSRVPFEHIPTFAAIANEFRRSNLRGTLAMAKVGGNANSATSEWFVNLNDNSANLDNQNGGFTVFARVLGSGMTVVDTIAALPRYTIGGSPTLEDIPLRDVVTGQTSVEVRNLVTVNNVVPIPVYPPGARSVLTFLAQSSDPTVATASVSGSTLTVTPVATGTTILLVRARDTQNNVADTTLTITVGGGVAIITPPQSQHMQPGAPLVLSVTAQGGGLVAYQWRKNDVPIPGATGFAYTVGSVSAADMGIYSVTATSGGNTATSAPAIVTVNVPGTSRLVNVSTRGNASADEALTPGFVMRGTGTKRLVLRAVGPSLTDFGVSGAVADTKMTVIPLNQTNVILANDDWHAAPVADVNNLLATSVAVGAFPLSSGSKDAATVASLAVTNLGGYTVGIAPSGTATAGVALAEIYDADPADSPVRLINVSTLGTVTSDGLTPGFVIGGSAPKQLLIRAIGPTLANAPFNVPNTLSDPQLTIYPLGSSVAIATNNDWGDGGQATALEGAFASAGAFALPRSSRDAALVLRLPPGAYTAVATGVADGTGRAIVEVYDLDP